MTQSQSVCIATRSIFIPPALSGLRNDSYENEVRLIGDKGYASTGFLEVYAHGSWGPVCNLGKADADSACRQLGYTNSFSRSENNN